jgi:hypothetical protein
MAKSPRKGKSAEAAENGEQVSDLRVVARLLAMLLVKGRPLVEQAGTLAAAGFGTTEIANLLGSTPASVSQSVYMWRKSRSGVKKTGRNT